MQFIAVTSRQRNSILAAQEIVNNLRIRFRDPALAPDLLTFYVTPIHARNAGTISNVLREAWPEAVILGTTAAAVLPSGARASGRFALTVMAAALPDVIVAPIQMDLDDFEETPVCLENWQALLQVVPDPALIMLYADPYTTPINEILDSLNTIAPGVPVVGGLASGARRPGAHVLVLNGERHRSGLVGVALSGNIRADVIVSQGCRPVGQIFTITKAEGNVVLELSGEPAIQALQDMVPTLPEDDRNLIQEGLLFGHAIHDPSEGLGRGDFLVRPVVAVDHKKGTLSLPSKVGIGETICFHVWDDTLGDDLQMLLLPQLIDTRAAGAFLFGSWPSRGKGSGVIRPGLPAKEVQNALGYRVPMAGFLSAGEIGPLRGVNYLHMHSAALALVRPIRSNLQVTDRALDDNLLN